MKEIPNQQFTAEDTTASLLKICLNNPGKEGFDLGTLRSRNRVMDAIEKIGSGDIIKLEEADHATAQTAIRAVRWASLAPHYDTFAKQFAL